MDASAIPASATHIEHDDDDDGHERYEKRNREGVIAEHVTIKVSEHAHGEHRE